MLDAEQIAGFRERWPPDPLPHEAVARDDLAVPLDPPAAPATASRPVALGRRRGVDR